MTGRAKWGQDVRKELLRVTHQRPDQLCVGHPVRTETSGGLLDRPLEYHGGPVVERMGERHARMHQLEPLLGEGQGAQERRGEREGMHGRARVVDEARKCQLLRAAAAADRVGPLHHPDLPACLG